MAAPTRQPPELSPGDKVNLFNADITGAYDQVEFVVPTGPHHVRIHDSVLNNCSIKFEGGARGRFIFERCSFVGGTFETLGPSVVGITVRDCQFEEHGGIDIAYSASDLITVENNVFVRMEGVSVRCATSGVVIRNNNFENKLNSLSRKNPHIVIEPDGDAYSGGLCSILNNRFGPEIGVNAGPPQYCIRLGPALPVVGTMTSVRILDNDFYGRIGGALEDSASSPILITKAVKDSVVSGNFARNTYGGPVIEATALGSTSVNNVFDNRIEADALGESAPAMSDSAGWEIR